MDSYLVKPRIYMDRDGLTEILQGRKKRNLYDGRHKTGCAVCFGRRIFH